MVNSFRRFSCATAATLLFAILTGSPASPGPFQIPLTHGCLAYQGYMKVLGAQSYWPLTDGGGGLAQDLMGANVGSYVNAPAPAQLSGPKFSPATLAFGGNAGAQQIITSNNYANPKPLSELIWFRTTTGGGLLSFVDVQNGTPATFDRVLYVGSDGRVYFAIYTGSLSTAASTSAYNDGAWHLAIGTLGPAGQILYVDDGTTILNLSGITTGAQIFTGYWRIGFATVGALPNFSNAYFTGNLVGAAVFSRQINATEAANIFRLGTSCMY